MGDETPDDGPVVVTLRDVYNTVSGLAKQMTGIPDRISDHERRLRSIERTIYIIIGAGLALQVIVPLVITNFVK